jgi:hypothetical protein
MRKAWIVKIRILLTIDTCSFAQLCTCLCTPIRLLRCVHWSTPRSLKYIMVHVGSDHSQKRQQLASDDCVALLEGVLLGCFEKCVFFSSRKGVHASGGVTAESAFCRLLFAESPASMIGAEGIPGALHVVTLSIVRRGSSFLTDYPLWFVRTTLPLPAVL